MNLILATSLTLLSGWWISASLATRERRIRPSAWIATLAACATTAGAWGLALGPTGIVPTSAIRWIFLLMALETPLWTLALLAWPGQPAAPGDEGTKGYPASLTISVLAAALLFWDFLYRPIGGIPELGVTRMAWMSWGFVLVSLSWSASRGSRIGRGAHYLLFTSLLLAVAMAHVVTVFHDLPSDAIALAGFVATLLRLATAEGVRRMGRTRGPASGRPRASTSLRVFLLVGTTVALLGLRASVERPVGIDLLTAIFSLACAILVYEWSARRDRRRAENSEPAR